MPPVPRPRAVRGVALGGLLGLAVGLGALALSLREADPAAIGAAFARAGVGAVAAGTAIHILVQVIYALRWRLLLSAPNALPLPRTLGIVGLGYLANYTLPGRPGELVRAALARALGGVPLALGLASLVLEKVLDGATILLSALAFASAGEMPVWLRASAALGGAAFALAGVGLVLAVVATSRAAGQTAAPWVDPSRQPGTQTIEGAPASSPHPSPLPRGERTSPSPPRRFVAARAFIRTRLAEVAAPSEALASPPVLGRVLFLGLLSWCAITAHLGILSLAVGVETGLAGWLLLYAALGLASVIPGAPGYVGTYQLAAVLALGTFGVERESAFVVATLYQLSRLLGAGLVGAWAITREGLPKRACRRGLRNILPGRWPPV